MATITIKPGDTLSAIARANSTTVAELQKANQQITNPNRIFAGDVLNLPEAPKPTVPKPPVVPPAIEATSIASAPRIATIQPTPPPPLSPIQAKAKSIQDSIQSQLSSARFEVGELQDTRQDLTNRLDFAVENRVKGTEVLEQARQKAGLTQKEAELTKLNREIAAADANFQRLIESEETDPNALLAQVIGRTGDIRRQAAIELGALSAQAQVLQGDIQSANQTVQQTLELAFADEQNKINDLLTQINLNRDSLTAAETKQANALTLQLQARQNELEDLKAEQQNIQNIALEAAQRGVDAETVRTISAAGSVEGAMVRASEAKVFEPEPEPLPTTVIDVGGRTVLINTQTGETIRDLGVSESQLSRNAANFRATVGGGGSGTEETVVTPEAPPKLSFEDFWKQKQELQQQSIDPNTLREEYDQYSREYDQEANFLQTTVDVITQAASLAGAKDQRETTKEIMTNALNQGNNVRLFSQIANNVEEGLTGEVKTDFANARTDVAVMVGMRDAIEQYIAADGEIGLLKGKAQDIAANFGQLANSDDPEFARLGAMLTREFQSYRNNMTGAAFTPQESAEYAKVNPTVDKALDLNLAVMDGALDQLENRIISTIEQRVPGAETVYERAVTGGEPVEDTTWDRVGSLPIGSTFYVQGKLYQKQGADSFVEL